MCYLAEIHRLSCRHRWRAWAPCVESPDIIKKPKPTMMPITEEELEEMERRNENPFPIELCSNVEDKADPLPVITVPGDIVKAADASNNIWCPHCHLWEDFAQHGWICCVCRQQNIEYNIECQNEECFAQRIEKSWRNALATRHTLCKRCTPSDGARNLRRRAVNQSQPIEITLPVRGRRLRRRVGA